MGMDADGEEVAGIHKARGLQGPQSLQAALVSGQRVQYRFGFGKVLTEECREVFVVEV